MMRRFSCILITCALWLANSAAHADVTVAGQTIVRLRPPAIGGTNIIAHDSNGFVSSTSPNYQSDAAAAHVPVIRTNAYPDSRTTNSLAFFDAKVQAIVSAGAVPVLLVYLPVNAADNHPYSKNGAYGLYCNADGTIGGSATIATNFVYLVKHYMGQDTGNPNFNPFFAAHPVLLQYWQVGNEPDSAIDFQATPPYYSQLFLSVHNALLNAGVRDNVKLMGPVVSYDYRWSSPTGGNTRMLDYFLTHCNSAVDIVDYHSYAGSGDDSGLLNTPHKMDNFYNVNRPVSLTPSTNPEDSSADYGQASMLLRMNNIPFARPSVGMSITEHNSYNSSATGDAVHHGIGTGLWNLQMTHFNLYNPRSVMDTSFVFDTFGNGEGGFGHYDSAKNKDAAYWALYVRNTFTGPLLLGQATTGNLNSAGNPNLLVTATRDNNFLYLEVINRNTASGITDLVHLNGLTLASGTATVYQLSSGVTPDTGTALPVAANFSYQFPAESATIFKIALSQGADFALTAAPSSQEVNPGGGAFYPVTITPLGGFAGTPTYSVSGLPSGATAAFYYRMDASSSAALSVSTASGTPAGSYPLAITAASGALTHTYTVTLNVANPDYQFVMNPVSRSVAPGVSYTFSFTVMALGGFNGPIYVTAKGLPSSVTVGIPDPHPLDTSGTGGISLSVGAATAPGVYPFTFTGTSGSAVKSVAATLSVPGVSVAVSPSSQSVAPGSSASYTVTVTPIAGFSGAVTLSSTGQPSGSTATFSPASVTIPSNSTKAVTSTLTVATTSSTPSGAASLTVAAATSAQTQTAPATLTVTGAAADVTSQVTVTRQGFRYNRARNLLQQVVVLTNNGPDLSGPVSLALDNLTLGVALYGATGTTASGSSYQDASLSGATLASGASATVALSFYDPSRQPLDYTPRVLAGPGTR